MRALRDPQSWLTALCGLTLALGMMFPASPLPYLSVALGSPFALSAALRSLRSRSLDVNFLMVLAAAGAVGVARPLEAAVLLFLFSLSSTLEAFALARTKSAIEGLIHLRPDRALRVLPSGDESVLVSELQVGDLVRVLPFEALPVDGQVVDGASAVNEAAMTGEAEPVAKSVGDRVFAGTQNLEGALLFRVSAAVGDTTLERIVSLVREAQDNKASGERISSWFGQRYTFFVVLVFALSFAARTFVGQATEDALYAALTLLVALSPCALVISTPASTLSALAFAARKGILVRGGQFIEVAGTITVAGLDKTGTLTSGRFELGEICVCHEGDDEGCKDPQFCWSGSGRLSDRAATVLRLAATVEAQSTHPIAEAVVRAAALHEVPLSEARDTAAFPGMGLTAVVDGVPVRVGQRRFFEDHALLPSSFAAHVNEIQEQGMTAVIVQTPAQWAALGLRDAPRAEAKDTLQQLQALGVRRIAMLTGDHEAAATAVAHQMGLCEVHAGLLPEEKAAWVQEAVAGGGRVMVVGDGINDAPVLASAHLGVAMGGLGSDIALNAADVVLMQDRLDRLPLLIRLGRMTNGVIRANLVFAVGVILLLVVGTILIDALAPQHRSLILPLAVVGHEGSTVLVILNGLRLLRGPNGS